MLISVLLLMKASGAFDTLPRSANILSQNTALVKKGKKLFAEEV
jgi:hypothetical protein